MNITLRHLPQCEVMVSNITAIYDAAEDAHVEEGLSWYDEALDVARNLAAGTSYSVEQVAGVMAVISSALRWELNRTYPRAILDYHCMRTPVEAWRAPDGKGMAVTHRRRQACLSILEGADPRQFLGPKTGAFFANILGDVNAVTVDRWAIRVAVANPKAVGATYAALTKISDAYVEAANERLVTPRGLQAACWISYRDGKRIG